MSDTLEDKLREVLHLAGFGSEMTSTEDEAIAQIKAAFESEGWRPIAYKMPMDYQERLTGQEFYDRFKAELDKEPIDQTDPETYEQIVMLKQADRHDKALEIVDAYIKQNVLRAAKRAAGIQEDA